jgi:hypothetical protein
MVIASNEIDNMYNFIAAICTWFLLAGFFILPGTFSFLQSFTSFQHELNTPVGRLLDLNKALIAIAIICFIIGAFGTSWLWYKFRGNYIWLLAHLFL